MAGDTKTVASLVEKPATLARLRKDIASGAVKAADLAATYYDRIAALNPQLNVYLSLTKDRALEQAARVDAMAAKGDPLPPLAGIPVGIKDVLVMRGAPSTAGSKILQGLSAALRRHRGGEARGRWCGAAGQAELRRVRHGLVERELRLRAGAQSGGSGAGAGRIERRLGRGRGRQHGGCHAGDRYRRLHSPAGQLLRSGRRAAHLRPRLALWPHCLCVFARPRRTVRRKRARRRHAAGRDRRSRSQRRDQFSGSGARLCS